MNAYQDGRYTAEAIAARQEPAALHEKANALLVEAIRARTDVARELHRGALRPEEAQAHREVRPEREPGPG